MPPLALRLQGDGRRWFNANPADFARAKAWIELNRDVIIAFWEGDILYTDEALAALRKLEA